MHYVNCFGLALSTVCFEIPTWFRLVTFLLCVTGFDKCTFTTIKVHSTSAFGFVTLVAAWFAGSETQL